MTLNSNTKQTDLKQGLFTNRRFLTGLALAGILLFGLFLRISYLREITNDPSFSYPQIDPGFHDYWAQALVSGDWTLPEHILSDPQIPNNPYIRPPGYPFFLAFIYYLSGSSYVAPRIVQMGLGLVNCLLAFFLARNLFGRGTGLILAALMSVYWVFIFFEGELLAPVLLITLGLCLMHVLRRWYDKRSFWRAFTGGAVLALFALCRANILMFVPVVLAWFWWVARRRGNVGHVAVTWLAFILGTMVVISPATIRNYLVAQDFVFITSNAGLNLYIANNKDSDGIAPRIPILKETADMDNWTNFQYTEIISKVGKLHGRELKPSEVSSYFAREAVDYMLRHPFKTLKLMLRKTALFWGPEPVACNKELYYEKQFSPTLRHIPGFPMALSFGAVGLLQLFLGRKRRIKHPAAVAHPTPRQLDLSLLMLLFILTYFLSHLPFVVAGRYRVPIIPFLLLFAAYSIHHMWLLAASRKVYGLVGWATVLFVLFMVARTPVDAYQPDLSRWYFSRACAYRYAKRYNAAIEACRQTVRIKPGFVKAYIELGNNLIALGKADEAIHAYSEALRRRPDYAQAHNNLGVALASQGRLDEAIYHFSEALHIKPDYPKALCEMGNVLAAQGKTTEAIAHYSRALQIKPNSPDAHNNLGVALAAEGKIDEAVTHYSQVLRLRPNALEAHNNLGNAMVAKGKLGEAIRHYSQALRIRSASPKTHNNLAFALAKQGNWEQAIHHYSQALRINPNYAEAHSGLGHVLFLNGRLSDAISHLKKALELKPSAPAQYLLKRALAAQARATGRQIESDKP